MPTNLDNLVVLYDGSCPYCAREIKHYMRLDSTQKIHWIDVVENPDYLEMHNITWVNAMEKLHTIENGDFIHIGVDSFIEIWRRISRYRFLSQIASFKPVYFILAKVYDHFAIWRFERRCTTGNICKPRNTSLT